MRVICLLPDSLIDWAATGAMISAMAACVIGFFQFRQTEKIKKMEKLIAEKDLKAELFDKRYEIYSLFVKFFEVCCQLLKGYKNRPKDCELNFEPRGDLKTILCSDFNNLSGFFAWQDCFAYRKKHIDDSESCKDKSILLCQKSDFLNKKFFDDSLYKLKMAKFCFSPEISDVVVRFAKVLLKDIFVEADADDENQMETEEFYLDMGFIKKIRESVEEIKSKKIISKMENEIALCMLVQGEKK